MVEHGKPVKNDMINTVIQSLKGGHYTNNQLFKYVRQNDE